MINEKAHKKAIEAIGGDSVLDGLACVRHIDHPDFVCFYTVRGHDFLILGLGGKMTLAVKRKIIGEASRWGCKRILAETRQPAMAAIFKRWKLEPVSIVVGLDL